MRAICANMVNNEPRRESLHLKIHIPESIFVWFGVWFWLFAFS